MSSPILAEITLVDVGKMLGVSRQRVHELVRASFIPKTASGKVIISDAAQGYRKALLKEKAERTHKAADEKFRAARSADLEMRVAERSRRLIEQVRAEAIAVVDEFAGALRADLSAVGANATDHIPTRHKIEDLIDAAFAEHAARAAREAERAEKALGDLHAGPKVNARSVGQRKQALPRKHGKARAA